MTSSTEELGGLSSLNRMRTGFRTMSYSDNLNYCFGDAKNATYAWVIYTAIYWTILVVVPCIVEANLNRYQFYFWFFGMIGDCSVYYAVKGDKPADSPAGKPLMALTCLCMFADWCTHAFVSLGEDTLEIADGILMVFHAFAVLWATLFFYNRAIKNGRKLAWMTLLLEWLDIVFICIVILVLHTELNGCLSKSMCIGYCVALVLQMFFWFFPILFGYSDTERFIHIHMVIVDTVTDLPLVVIVALTGGYKIHWFVFIDTAFKLILLLRSYSYHLIFNICLRHRELLILHEQQEEQIALELELFDKGETDEDIKVQVDDMIVRHKTQLDEGRKNNFGK